MTAIAIETRGRLSPAQRALLAAEILRAYVRVRRLLRNRTLPQALAELRGEAVGGGAVGAARRLGDAVRRTLRAIPADTRCLTQSLVLTALLARRGIDSQLVISVDASGTFSAHAWVECGGRAVLPTGGFGGGRLVQL